MNKTNKKPSHERDKFGSRAGSISSRVNSVVSTKWKTDEEIAKEAGLELRQARARLYHAAENGVFERERVIRYRIKPKEKVRETPVNA